MSDLSFLIARVAILLLLWFFIFLCVGLIRRDMFGSHLNPRKNKEKKGSNPSQLNVASGPLAGTIVPLTGADILIGRDSGTTLNLIDDFVSNKHARIFSNERAWFIEDLHSTNGTFLNGEKLADLDQIEPGDKIKIGHSLIKVEK